jgi:hypothetical protein
MEMQKLITVLEETLSYLRSSQPSDYSHTSVEEIIARLESVIAEAKNAQTIDKKQLSLLFAPTGAIQETSINNGWSKVHLRISKVVDQFTNDKTK